ncbi:unnamed protein product [Cochlearia groenlandica]
MGIRSHKWSHHTNGLIRDLLPRGSITSESLVVNGNALYFKGKWEKKFDKSLTKEHNFQLVQGKPVRVRFMKSYENQYIGVYDGFKVLRLPYRQGNNGAKFSMSFYLPDKKDGLNDLVKEMTSTQGFLDSHSPKYKVEVCDFRIPKFKIVFGFEASRVLDGIDMVTMSIYQKAFVEIDEEGAEAAVVTFLGMKCGLSMFPRPPPLKIDFVADHPFLFFIREDTTGTILFAGQIFNPK